MFRRFTSLMALLSFIFASSTSAQAMTIDVKDLKDVKDYKIYYGEANKKVIKELSQYDMVIIEPYAFTKKQIEQLKQSGTIVLGYVSVMELEDQHRSQVVKSDYYYQNNEKMRIEQWDTYIMNLQETHYRDILLTKVEEQIVEKGIDGVFLDTVGDIDDYFYDQPTVQKQFRDAYVTFLKEIKEIDSNLILVQNWGFPTLKSASLNLVDGVLWEDFNQEVISKDEWSQDWIRYFKKYKNQLVTFTVTPNKQSKAYSKKIGFIPTMNGNDIYNK